MLFCVFVLIAKQTLWTRVYMFSMFSMILKLSFLECFRNNRKTVVMIILKNSQENICGGIFLSSKLQKAELNYGSFLGDFPTLMEQQF